MQENKYISVKVSGTPVRKGGFIPIVNINEACFEISDSYPAIMSRDACVYTVSVQPDMTVYKLVFHRMRHHGDGADARLVIGFSVPAGYVLPEGADAVRVLHTLLEAFVGSFALALPDGSFEYRFGRFDTASLENISKSIPLVPSDSTRVVMKDDAPRGAIEAGAESIVSILSNIDRKDFADISELIVAEHINASVGGIAAILKADPTLQETASSRADSIDETAEDDGRACDSQADKVDELSTATEEREKSDAGYDSGYSHSQSKNEEDIPDRALPQRHRTWPILLAGIILGAILAFLALGLLDTSANPADNMADRPAAEDTGAVVPSPDTLPPAKVETVYVEKKAEEKVKGRSSSKPSPPPRSGPKSQPAPAASAVPPPAPVDESAPAPVYKYDPEAERSL